MCDFEARVEAAARAIWEHQHQHDTVREVRTWEGAQRFTTGPYAEGVARARELLRLALTAAGIPELLDALDDLDCAHDLTADARWERDEALAQLAKMRRERDEAPIEEPNWPEGIDYERWSGVVRPSPREVSPLALALDPSLTVELSAEQAEAAEAVAAIEREAVRSTPLLTAREVSEILSVSAETVLRWTRRGDLPAFRLPSGAIRYSATSLDEWLNARKMGRG